LIEREWLQGGYPFGTRHSKSGYAYTLSSVKSQRKNYAPSFILFIDCVWQIFNQFPISFEFSEHFLITLVQHSYASQFGKRSGFVHPILKVLVNENIWLLLGTFLCDNVCEREQLKLMSRTVSLWSHINRPEMIQNYMNPVYEPNPLVIWPSVHPISLVRLNGRHING